jgi:hypothetical protein
MTALAGNKTVLKVSGTSTVDAGEACSLKSGAGTTQIWQVTAATKRVLDPSHAIVVKDGGTPVGSTLFTLDYLFGRILFNGYTPAGAITIDDAYFPMLALAIARKVDWQRTKALLESTVMPSPGRTRICGLKDLAGTLEGITPETDDLDPGTGGEQSMQSFFDAGTPKLLEASFGGHATLFRAWILIPKIGHASSFEDLVTHAYDFTGTNGGPASLFGQVATGLLSGWGS